MTKQEDATKLETKELGYTGLERSGGDVLEEFHPALRGRNGVKVLREMRDNDSTIGASLHLIDSITRQVEWRVDAAPDHPQSEEAARFLEECLEDMSHTWADFLSEALSFVWFGWSYFEKIYKVRGGTSKDPTKNSKYSDGKIGWRKIPIRAQETLDDWDFDAEGGIRGMWQMAAPNYVRTYLPIEKCILFRTALAKNNPEGRSLLRNAYRSWFFLKRIQEIEAIGIERDLVGLPVLELPEAYFEKSATPAKQQALREFTRMLMQIRRGEHEGVAIPSVLDREGKPTGYKLSLLTTGGSRTIDPGAVVERYEKRVGMVMLTNFLFLGMDKVGAQALSGDMTSIFIVALKTLLTTIEQTFNRFAVAELMTLNGYPPESWPSLKHGEIQRNDVRPLAETIMKLVSAGALTPDSNIEDFMRAELRLPKRESEDDAIGTLVSGQSSSGSITEGSGDTKTQAATLNELSLAIERLARVGDLDLLNATRAAYASLLGLPDPPSLESIGPVPQSQEMLDP